jgi:hypothetical protein
MGGSVVLLAALLAVGVAIMSSSVTAGGGAAGPRLSGSVPVGLCQDSAPAGASAETRAYVAASNAAVPEWTAISHAIGANGGRARPEDFVSEVNADSQLLSRLGRTKFSGPTASLATDFEAYVHRYLLQMQLIIRRGVNPPAIATLDNLYRQRAAASGLLRTALGLSSTYACQWLRPGTALGAGAPTQAGGGTTGPAG